MTPSNSAVDSIFRLRQVITQVMDNEFVESVIAKELQDIERTFEADSGSFYEGMKDESLKRAQLLLSMRFRAQSLIDKLNTFLLVNGEDD